jgi:hypothetical protein
MDRGMFELTEKDFTGKVDLKTIDKISIDHKPPSPGAGFFIYDDAGRRIFYVDRPKYNKPIDIGIYGKESRKERVYSLRSKKTFHFPLCEYFFYDKNDRLIAIYEKNVITSFFKIAWDVYTDEARTVPVANAKEEAISLAFLQRVGGLGDSLKSDFKIYSGDKLVGVFIRKLSADGMFLMDLSKDPGRKLDRQVAFGLALVLDIGEYGYKAKK